MRSYRARLTRSFYLHDATGPNAFVLATHVLSLPPPPPRDSLRHDVSVAWNEKPEDCSYAVEAAICQKVKIYTEGSPLCRESCGIAT